MSQAAVRGPLGDPIIVSPSLDELAVAIEANEHDHLSRGFGSLPGAEYGDEGDLVWFVTGRPQHWLNGVAKVRLRPRQADRRIDETLERCRSRALPQSWAVLPTTAPADLPQRLLDHGISHDGDMPLMAGDLDRIPAPVAAPPGLRIDRVTDDASRERFLAAFVSGFDMGPDLADVFRYLVTNAGPEWRRFVATLDGRPVGTAGVHLAGGVAGLYNVETLAEFRRRGIGAAVSAAALRDARAQGYRVGILGSTDLGRNVYRRLGFEDVCAMRVFVWRPPGAPIS